MFKWRQAERGGRFLSLSGTLLLAAALALCAVQAAAAEEVVSDPKTAPCKGLKPYNNLDELLYQFYINLESDCLFEMPTAELEEAWDVKILDKERAKSENYYPLSETEFYNKPYKSERDAFYIEKGTWFYIKITKEYYDRYGSLFPSGAPPKLISDALVKDFEYPYVYRWNSELRIHYWILAGHSVVGFTIPDQPEITTIIISNGSLILERSK